MFNRNDGNCRGLSPLCLILIPKTAQCDSEVCRILNLQNVADSMPDAFSDIAKVTRSHIPAANVSVRLEVPTKGQGTATPAIGGHGAATTLNGGLVEAVVPQRNRGRPLGSIDTRPNKKASLTQPNPLIINTENPCHEVISNYSYDSPNFLLNSLSIQKL